MLDKLGWLTAFNYLNFSNTTSSTRLFYLYYLYICSMTVLKAYQHLCCYALGFRKYTGECCRNASLSFIDFRCTTDSNVAACEEQAPPVHYVNLQPGREDIEDQFQELHGQRKRVTHK